MIIKYLSPQEKSKRIKIVLLVDVIYFIALIKLLLTVKAGWVMVIGLFPIIISGLLLGVWVPLILGVINYAIVGYLLRCTDLFPPELYDTNQFIGEILFIVYTLVGIGVGKLRELTFMLRLSEENMRKARDEAEEANRSKSDFLACMSHEIRTPMNSVIGFANLLKEDLKEQDHLEKLNIIIDSGNSLLNLINDILDFSRIEAGKLEWVNREFAFKDLFSSIKNIFSLKARDNCIDFIISIDEHIPEIVEGDFNRIQQVIINLVGNAFKFTREGSVAINCSYEEKQFIIKVCDTGIGIPPDKLEAVFFAFIQADSSITREYKGTGLGLAISKQLVDQMGGSIKAESVLGEGAVFTVKLPLKTLLSPKKEITSLTTNPKRQGSSKSYKALISDFLAKEEFHYRILIAEDNDFNREFLILLLQRLNVQCDYAIDGRQALDELKLAKKNNSMYDLLLLDMQMPFLSGLDVIKAIREKEDLKDLYVITLTANVIKGDSEKYIAAGCNDYIAKPIDETLLLSKIYDLLKIKYGAELPDIEYFPMEERNPGSIINPTKIDEVILLIKDLKNIYEFFNPRDIVKLKPRCSALLPPEIYKQIELQLDEAIRNYDDGLLPDVIENLEELVNPGL